MYAAFEIDPYVNPHRDQITILHETCRIVLTGEVAEIAAKRRAYYTALEVPGVTSVDDRLHVKPAQAMGDDEILAHLIMMLSEDLAFKHYGPAIDHKGKREALRCLDEQAGFFLVHVEGGTVYLRGEVKSLCDRRLAEVMQLREAILLALDVDPFVDYLQLAIRCRAGEVILEGAVPVAEQIKLAEHDCCGGKKGRKPP